jgi:Flp pilus assembly protein TadG
MVAAMALSSMLSRLQSHLRAFRRSERGNVMITFALATIPVIAFMGAAVDYSRGNSAKAALQAAVDSVALMLSKDAQTLSATQLQTKADAYFKAIFNRPEVTNIVLTPTFYNVTAGDFKLTVVATGKVPTSFTKVVGQENMNLSVSSQVAWGMKKLELALALDNTGSMAWSSKMTELKKAAKSLLATLQKAAKNPGDIKVAIIPFDTTVNLGTAYKNNNWFDIDSIDCNGWKSGTGCNSSNWKNYWEGCVRDRTYPYDGQDNPPSTAVTATLFPVYDCGSLTTLLPLTSDWTALNSKIDAMSPNGMTNVTIGLAWAFHALTKGAPLSEAADPSPDIDKVIILLTDGENTESWKNSANTAVYSPAAIDARTTLACNNVKAANIKLYTVRVIDGNVSLLQACATNPSMFFDVQNASQLNTVFSAIAQNLANLRIAK